MFNRAVLANPAALKLEANQAQLPQDFVEALRESLRVIITPEDMGTLRAFYETMCTKAADDDFTYQKLARKYVELGFDGFLQRLITKRFDWAYLDGRVLARRHSETNPEHDHAWRTISKLMQTRGGSKKIKGRLLYLGSGIERHNLSDEYLTLPELAVSGMLLMIKSDVIVGRGGRLMPNESPTQQQRQWPNPDYRKRFFAYQAGNQPGAVKPTVAATVSYPAGIEFRNLHTAAFDAVFCFVPQFELYHDFTDGYADYRLFMRQRQIAAEFDPTGTLYGLYGNGKTALNFGDKYAVLEDIETTPQDWVRVEPTSGAMLQGSLYLPPYKAKISRILKQTILGHELQMRELNMGRVLNIKGLGLGAFGINACNQLLQDVFLDALTEVVASLTQDGQLRFIKHINVINLPREFRRNYDASGKPSELIPLVESGDESANSVTLTMNCMDPTARYIVPEGDPRFGNPDYEVGGVIICGDPATLPGNEARVTSRGGVGLPASSSDDPAQLYSMAEPHFFDPVCCNYRIINLGEFDVDAIAGTKLALMDATEKYEYATAIQHLATNDSPNTTLLASQGTFRTDSTELTARNGQDLAQAIGNLKQGGRFLFGLPQVYVLDRRSGGKMMYIYFDQNTEADTFVNVIYEHIQLKHFDRVAQQEVGKVKEVKLS